MGKDEATPSERKNIWVKVLFWLALSFSIFQLVVPIFLSLIDLQLKSIHIIFGLSTALFAYSISRKAQGGGKPTGWDWFLIAIILAANINIFLNWQSIYSDPGEGNIKDWVLGALVILSILEVSRRSTGWTMPIIVVLMFIYVFTGSLIPGAWGHPGFSFEYVMESVYYSPMGIYGSVVGYSATFIGVLIIFGSILLFTGGGKTFIDLALLATGRFVGGPAKAAVVASALFGTISGSPAANVSVTGNYTIPLMKSLGYPSNFAGGVEAMASTGGTITPPIMGIVAFVMAELIGVPYIKIIGYALIPCFLYYIGIFAGIHFQALRLKMAPVPKSEIPHWKSVLTWQKLAPFSLPLVVLLWLLLKNYSLTQAGFFASISAIGLHIVFVRSPGEFRERLAQISEALSDGGKALSTIVPVFVTVGMLINLIGITGAALKVSELIVNVGETHLIIGLLSTAIVPLVLGTALTTSATYIIAAAMVAPSLLRLGIDQVSAHMYLVYWAALSAITPPTCVPAVVAARIAGGNWLKTAMVGMRLGAVAFLIPFFFVIEPSLLARGAPNDILLYTLSAVFGAVLIAYSLFGHSRGRTNIGAGIAIRVLCAAAGFFLLYPSHYLSLYGVATAVIALLGNRFFSRSKETNKYPAT
ncbi:MAG: TRAP transporter fused permease subunit [Chloroflexi bacterium]|nr:TRAP transporter fused permease subunit [Chloroflexota bacterium]